MFLLGLSEDLPSFGLSFLERLNSWDIFPVKHYVEPARFYVLMTVYGAFPGLTHLRDKFFYYRREGNVDLESFLFPF